MKKKSGTLAARDIGWRSHRPAEICPIDIGARLLAGHRSFRVLVDLDRERLAHRPETICDVVEMADGGPAPLREIHPGCLIEPKPVRSEFHERLSP